MSVRSLRRSVHALRVWDALHDVCVSCDAHIVSTGLQLSMMGIDTNEFNCTMMLYIRELLLDIKPLVSDVDYLDSTVVSICTHTHKHAHTNARVHTHIHTHADTHTQTHTEDSRNGI